MSKLVKWEVAKKSVCDASGITQPEKWMWEKIKGIYYPASEIQTIDCTPTWEGLTGYFLIVLSEGNEEAQTIVQQQIRRMAIAADNFNKCTKLLAHIASMADDAYLIGHPEWIEITKESNAIYEDIKRAQVKVVANSNKQEMTWEDFEGDVYDLLEERGEMTRSDAQGVAMIKEKEMRQWYADGKTASDVADLILK